MNKNVLLENVLFIKWHVLFAVTVVLGAPATYFGLSYFGNEINRQRLAASTNLMVVEDQVRQIEEEENAIVENIGQFSVMAENGVLSDENRVEILESVRAIRDEHNLFVIGVDISEQERTVLPIPEGLNNVDEQISLRGSKISLNMSLLHEADFQRFYNDFTDTGKLLVPTFCRINLTHFDESTFLNVAEHLSAVCEFYWYTLRREPYVVSEF